MMDGELYADFMLLFLLCHQSRVEIQPTPIAKVTLDRKTGKAKKAKATSQKKLVADDDAEAGDGDDSRRCGRGKAPTRSGELLAGAVGQSGGSAGDPCPRQTA